MRETVALGQAAGGVHQRRSRPHQSSSRPNHRQISLRLRAAMLHRTRIRGILTVPTNSLVILDSLVVPHPGAPRVRLRQNEPVAAYSSPRWNGQTAKAVLSF